MQVTLQELNPESFQKLTVTASDFHARLSALLETDEASKILAELSFLKSCGWLKSGSLRYYSPKMSRDYLATIKVAPSEPSSEQWMNWGMMSNGRCLTAQILESPKTEKGWFIVGHLRGTCGRKVFPIIQDGREADGIPRQTANTLIARYGQSMSTGSYVVENKQYGKIKQIVGGSQGQRVAVPVLTPDRINKRQNGRRFKENGEPMFTLTGQDRHGVMIKEATAKGYAEANEGDLIDFANPGSTTRRGRVKKEVASALDTRCRQGVLTGYKIRKLTPRECFRLQGFPDDYFDRAATVNSDSQLYNQAGNSVTVNVVYEIAKRLKRKNGNF